MKALVHPKSTYGKFGNSSQTIRQLSSDWYCSSSTNTNFPTLWTHFEHTSRRSVWACPLGWTLQGELLFEEHDYDRSFESLHNALAISNDNWRGHEIIGLIFTVNGDFLGAIREMTMAAHQNPSNPDVHFCLAGCGKMDDAT